MKAFCFSLIVGLTLLLAPWMAAGPKITFEELVLRNEQNPRFGFEAKRLAETLGLPKTIYFENGLLVDALGVESGRPVYAVIANYAHPFEGGRTLFYDEIVREYDLALGIVNPTGPIVMDRNWPQRRGRKDYLTSVRGYLLVPEWTADKVMAFDPLTGDLLDTAYIHSNSAVLASPKEARLSPRGTITVSDQIQDLVQDFDTAGTYLRFFAPAGGVNTAILDNIRGHAYRPNGRLVVTVGSSANQNSVAEFDSAGSYLGQFIAAGAGGLNSPFGILFRTSDVLVSASSSPTGVHRYDLNGAHLSQWASITSFPQQIAELANGNIAVANFSGTGQTGVRIYAPDGTFLRLLSGVTGNRGVFQLGNGHFLTSNGAGIHELDTNGVLLRTIAAATNLQYIDLVNRTLVGVREESPLPRTTALYQNYPNPFNPTTTLRYALPKASKVTLTIYNILGQQIAALQNDVQDVGFYNVVWSGRNDFGTQVASGVYFYRMEARPVDGSEVFTSIRKMMFLK